MMDNINIISTSVLKGKAIYGELLLKQGYQNYQIDDLAVNEFLDYEIERTGESTDLYLLSIKKILLYAIPIISNSNNKRGVALTAQFNSNAIILNNSSINIKRLAIGDKYILIGFAFPLELINNLNISVFEWKYFRKYPKDFTPTHLDISDLSGIKKIKSHLEYNLYTIDSSFYEDNDLYNKILYRLKVKLQEYTNNWTSILYQISQKNHIDLEYIPDIKRIKPFNDIEIIKKLNLLLEKQIDPTFTISYYETLQATTNWLLYNQIYLYGYDSPIVQSYLKKLEYIKSENSKVFIQLTKENRNNLLQTRAEKIAREQYPFYFSSIDRRGIFSKFNRFNINKLTKPHQQEINILLEKELTYQAALLNNNCPHIQLLKELNGFDISMYDMISNYNKLLPFIDFDRKGSDSHSYNCKNCTYEILCEHEVDFYSELKLLDNESLDGTDNLYTTQQIIVNRYKHTQISLEKSDRFSYSCKYCAKELGKSDDIIQVAHKDINFGKQILDIDIYRTIAFTTLNNVLVSNVNPIVLGIERKKVVRSLISLIRDNLESISYPFKKLNNEELIEVHIKFSALILCLCALISLNINVLKTDKQLLIEAKKSTDTKQKTNKSSIELEEIIDTETESSSDEEVSGGSIKSEFSAAFNIIKNSNPYKLLTISDDKIKSMILDYYRRIAKDIGDVIDTSSATRTNEQKITNEIIQSPVYAYLQNILAASNNSVIKSSKNNNFKQVMGIEIIKGTTGNLYQNIIKDKLKLDNDQNKYIHESYENIRSFLVDYKYKGSDINPNLSEFITSYEAKQNKKIINLISNPKHYIPDTNIREVIFELNNLNLIYCNDQKTITKHNFIKGKCTICGISIDKTSESYNQSIINLIDDEIAIDAFFDLYLNNCPIKDIHIYDESSTNINSKCIQCSISKKQLIDHDLKYYKQYLPKFKQYKKNQLNLLIEQVRSAVVSDEYIENKNKLLASIKVDELDAKNNQMMLSISKLFEINIDNLNNLSPTYLDSYIKLFYERYSYASNLSYDMYRHSDIEFYDFIKLKFFTGTKPIKIQLEKLPDYDYQNYDSKLKLFHLLSLFMLIIDSKSYSNSDHKIVMDLGKFIINKIIAQEFRRKEFNFAKLKSINQIVLEDDDELEVVPDELSDDEEGEETMFMAYDIDMDDMEDNIHGDLD